MEPINAGHWLVASSPESLATITAHLVRSLLCEAIYHAGSARIALSGGSTPSAMFRALATLSLPWNSVDWFWVDERAVARDSSRSNAGNAHLDLFQHVGIAPERVHAMPGDEPDHELAAARYEATLARYFQLPKPSQPEDYRARVPEFDLVLLGVGDDGHTASLFPGEDNVLRDDRWVISVPGKGSREPRLTLCRPVITAAKRVIVLAQGAAKRVPLTRAREQGPLPEIPSRLTQQAKGELLWLVDSAADPRG